MNKIPSVVQILVAELLAVWGLSSFAMAVWNTVKPGRLEQIYLAQ